MAPRRARTLNRKRKVVLLVVFAMLAAAGGLVVSSGDEQETRTTRAFGSERLVAWETFPEMGGEMCQWMPASASEELYASLAPMPLSAPALTHSTEAPPRPSDAAREMVAKRRPVSNVTDPLYGFAGLTVDVARNEVIIAEENLSTIVVYDRMENTPPTARMSEPKRVIGGQNAFLEYACGVYVDPANGDVYAINNDTMNWMPVFGRDQRGDVAPKRKLATPHTTAGIVVDEDEQELFLTIQDDHAVVVYPKLAQEQDKVIRVLQGTSTGLADPHGITIDTKRNELWVTNWGSTNNRPAFEVGKGGGGFGQSARRTDFPVGRNRTYPASGKFLPASVTVYPKNAHGDTAPSRVITGPRTGLDWPTSLAVHPDRGELFVANDTGHNVSVFRVTDNGDVAPIRVIKGPKTMIQNPTGVFVDVKNGELWVANFGSHSATVFPLDANGDVVPKRIIRSGPADAPAPMLGNPHTVAFDSKREEILVAN